MRIGLVSCGACELPTASSHFGSTGVLWVLTGTHPCGPPPKQNGGGYQSASSCCGFVEWIFDCVERVWNRKDKVRIPHKKRKNIVNMFCNSHGHSHDNGQESRRTEKGQTRFLHTPTGVKQGATTSFPFVFTSHRSRPCKECDRTAPKHLPHTQSHQLNDVH